MPAMRTATIAARATVRRRRRPGAAGGVSTGGGGVGADQPGPDPAIGPAVSGGRLITVVGRVGVIATMGGFTGWGSARGSVDAAVAAAGVSAKRAAVASSVAVWNRRSGSFASARTMTASSGVGTPARSADGRGGGLFWWAFTYISRLVAA